jgi:Immunity protein 21
MKSFKWIETTGGPIIILPFVEVKNWSGCFSTKSIEAQKIIDAEDFLDPNESDYGKACQIEDYVGIFDFGNDKAIVLGDEPLATTCFRLNETDVLIVRWSYAENDAEVEFHLQSNEIKRIKNWSLDGIINVLTADYVIFDSAEIGIYLKEKDALYFSLNLGEYHIKTSEYKPDSKTFLLIHKLEKSHKV